jgi:hypothetical protein
MFGFRKSHSLQCVATDWPTLCSLLEDDTQHAPVLRVYPSPARESFLQSLQRIDPAAASAVMQAGNQLHHAVELVQYPVVAIAGMLNSGKTSLVATFLSSEGRARTLRGVGHAQGTHRFVLWLPEKWKADAELWSLLLARLGEALGRPPELLGTDPAAAHQQYNNHDRNSGAISVPLVATDPALDSAGMGLLDCPDIVSDESLGLGAPTQRRELLGRAATLCSAFLVVASAEQSRDMTLGELMRIAGDLMPGVPRLLAVNKVRPREQTPDQVHSTFSPLADQYQVETIYAAYDFDIQASDPFIPRQLHNSVGRSIDPEESLPIFFALSKKPAENPPNAIGADRLLSSLPERLDRGRLFDRFRTALETNVRVAIWDRGRQAILDNIAILDGHTESARRCLMEVALEVFARLDPRGEIAELRLHQNERIIRQLSEAFVNTAPWYARWSVQMNASFRRVIGGAGDWMRRWLPTQSIRNATEDVRGRFRRGEHGGLLTAEMLRSLVRYHLDAHPMPHWHDDSPWQEACQAAIHRYDRDDFTTLDPRRLEEACAEMWAKVSVLKKGTAVAAPLLMLLTTFGAVLMIPFDLGTSVIASASISELLAASGLTAVTSIWAGGKNAAHVEQQAARQQLADLIAVLCDTFGVSRSESLPDIRVGGGWVKLPAPVIAKREPIGPTLASYQWQSSFDKELKRHLTIESR